MKKVLLDSDVILDFFLDIQPHSEYSSYVLSQIELKKIEGYLTAVIISNVYYLLRKISTHDRVIKILNQLMTLVDMILIDKNTILKAMNSKFKDFEDAIQNYACESHGEIDLILTRNTKDYRKSEISVLTPEQYYKMKYESK